MSATEYKKDEKEASTEAKNLDEVKKQLGFWLKWDKCEETRAEIEQLKSSEKWDELNVRLCHRIQFGTAGLRAKMGAGFALMNELTVIQATQGLLRHLQTEFKGGNNDPLSVVIGFDARHHSRQFAQLAAALFAHEQIHVHLFTTTTPTPFIPFSVSLLKAKAGIMVTASHNPKDDNGYKVYWANGAQIISPLDAKIADSIEHNLEPWQDKAWNLKSLDNNKFVSDPMDKVGETYFTALSHLCHFPSINSETPVKFVYTPVHGVGQPYAELAFKSFHFAPFISTEEQKEPDPDFTTVKYPNPEEGQETLECAIRTANANKADFILATDPDADRFCLGERDPTGHIESGWRILTGNQLGAVLGWWRWFTWRNRNPTVNVKDVYMVYSTVSSHILKSIGEVEGFNTIETLTGFKWLGNKSYEPLNNKKHVLFGFEEAIGYMCDPLHVLDKDGITAMAIGAEMCAYLKSIGRTLYEQLDHISTLYGYHINNNSYVICNQTDVMLGIFDRLRHWDRAHEGLENKEVSTARKGSESQESQRKDSRAHEHQPAEHKVLVQYSNKIKSHIEKDENEASNSDTKLSDETYVYPKTCGKYTITGIRDLTVGIEADLRTNKDEKPVLPCSAATQMITFYFDNGCEITIRASGTEPKIKWYSEIRKKPSNTDENKLHEQFRQEIKAELDELVDVCVKEFLEPDKNGLQQRETSRR